MQQHMLSDRIELKRQQDWHNMRSSA